MKYLKQLLLLPLFFTLSAAVGASGTGSTLATEGDPDTRIKLSLPPDERHLVLAEMRNFVIAIHDITAGIAAEDMEGIAVAARRMGSAASGEIPPRVVAKLPPTFIQLAGKVHSTFDMIAMDANDIGDGLHTIAQLSELTRHCIACHEIYQVDRLPAE